MLKRILTLSLSLLMLISRCPTVSVFAADTKPAPIVEDFDDGAVDASIVDLTADATVSRTVADGVGRGGGKALKITNLNNAAGIGFDAAYNYASDVSVLSYDIQVSKLPTPASRKNGMVVGGTRSSGGNSLLKLYRDDAAANVFSFTNQDNTKLCDVVVGKWYTIVMVRYYNKAEVWVIDESGNVVANHFRTSHDNSQPNYLLLRGTTNILDDGEILIDNVDFNIYSRDFGPSLMSDTLAAADVPLNTNSVTVTFDQPLDSLSATLTPEGGSAITCTMEAKKDANGTDIPLTYVASWESTLAPNTAYTLDFTGSYTKQGTSNREIYVDDTGKISFTTLDNSKVHLWEKPIISNVASNTEDETRTDISFKLVDNSGYANTSFTGAVMAIVLSDGQMVDYDIIVPEAPATTFPVGENITIDFGFTVKSGDTLQLIQMNTESGLTPLAFGKYPEE